MATSFAIPIREVVKHLNAFASGNASTTQTNYTTATPTTTQVVDPYFSLDFIKDKIVDAHGRLALEIANVRAHPWRAWITPSTVTVADSAAIGSTATNSKTIVGALGQVLIGGIPATEAAPERVRDYQLHGGTLYSSPYLYYNDGLRIYLAPNTNCTINVCTYERADVVTLIGATPPGNITIPDALVDALVAGATAMCIVESKSIEQASYFQGVFDKAIQSIRAGQTTMPMMTLPATA
jgi:hypothetical protein